MSMTPEERRDIAVAAVIAAGGTVASASPMAKASAPEVVVAYRLDVTAATPDVLAALAPVREETEVSTTGLIPWVDPELLIEVES